MDDNIAEKLKNQEEWNKERARIKPFIDKAVDYHEKARAETHWKNHEEAARLFKEAIRNYKDAMAQGPKYYLQDILERIERVLEEYMNNAFSFKAAGDNLKHEEGIRAFVDFIDGLNGEELSYIDSYDIACAFVRIAELYYEDGKLERAYEFYNRVINANSGRSFINRDSYFNMGKILFTQARFKEALVCFVCVLSFDMYNKPAIGYLEECLGRLGISQHKSKFLKATPNEAKKLIMEVL